MNLSGFNKMPLNNMLHYGFYIIALDYDGKVRVYGAKGISFEHQAQAEGPSQFESIGEALGKIKEWSIYIWNHNDRKYLVKEYGLTRTFVESFLGYTYPSED